MTHDKLMLGAVAYDPKVVTIWDGFQQYFADRGLPFDYILYTNYERQVEALFAGEIHVAWHSPLAWLQTERIATALDRRARAIAMRDTDCDLTSVVIVHSESDIHSIEDLRGRRVAVGAKDSPQATLIPLHHLAQHGLDSTSDFEVRPFDVLLGKHGDHIGGERDAARALFRGDCDAACILDANHLLFVKEGTLTSGATRVLTQTQPYDHCNFTILDTGPPGLTYRFRALLLEMSYADPHVRRLLDLEGLKRWLPGRTDGYAQLSASCRRFAYIDPFVDAQIARWK
ncbi:MAG: PhnD/SsuA/transferrin family substrate-binding protein [Bryobacterales bacterium]|nr:PhnD/SsuA/transferrin family substrate-binding protein [Bryobacterales bacterium]